MCETISESGMAALDSESTQTSDRRVRREIDSGRSRRVLHNASQPRSGSRQLRKSFETREVVCFQDGLVAATNGLTSCHHPKHRDFISGNRRAFARPPSSPCGGASLSGLIHLPGDNDCRCATGKPGMTSVFLPAVFMPKNLDCCATGPRRGHFASWLGC